MTRYRFVAGTAFFSVVVAALMFVQSSTTAAEKAEAKAAPKVVVYYFHRTQRCPTCKMIGAYVEESIAKGFADKADEVKLYLVDFQNPKNAAYAKYYKIERPTCVVVGVRDNQVVDWEKLPQVWTLVENKDQFLAYVQGKVQALLDN